MRIKNTRLNPRIVSKQFQPAKFSRVGLENELVSCSIFQVVKNIIPLSAVIQSLQVLQIPESHNLLFAGYLRGI